MQILTHRQIEQKIRRLAIEVLERNTEEQELFVVGMNNRGYRFAALLVEEIRQLATGTVHLTRVRVNPADPLAQEVNIETPLEQMQNKAVLLVDDVSNTGRTLFYALKPLMQILPGKLEVAVLVERTHKRFPIHTDYYGIALATTLMDNIRVELPESGEFAAFLE